MKKKGFVSAKTQKKTLRTVLRWMFFSLSSLSTQQGFAISAGLPASVDPGVMSRTLQSERPAAMRPAPSVTTQAQAPSSLGPQAEKIKFKLTKIVLQDNHAYTRQQLEVIYKDKLNTQISIAELQGIVQNITNYYRNNGYILSRAILPPQHVHNGVVQVRIIEGYIDQVKVIGSPKGARAILQALGNRVAQTKPLQISVLEYYLRLANEIPGMQVKAVLEPSKTKVGASDLNLSADESIVNASLSYDNYGTLYIGPQQWTASAAVNSIFRSGDSSRATYVTTVRPKELKYLDLSYVTPLGSRGTSMLIGGNDSKTRPELNLRPLKINGTGNTYYLTFQQPILRSRLQNLTLNAGFNYLDSQVVSFDTPLYTDHIRSLRLGASYDFSDRFRGANLFGLSFEQGLPILGASNNSKSLTVSRFGADGIYSKFSLQAARYQQLFWRLSAYLVANGQYSFEPLLSASQFSFGGSQLGRGYDPAEIIGDKGLAGSVELRMDFAPGRYLLQSVQPYAFYDWGLIWNLKNVIGVDSKQSATSAGAGARFVFNRYLTGNLMVAQPLTKSVAAEDVVGKGRLPRVFFSLVLQYS